MFGLFKKSIEKEYWKRIDECKASYVYIQNTRFSSAPNIWENHFQKLNKNNRWFNDNMEELKKILTEDQIKMTKNAINEVETIERKISKY